MTPEEMIAVVQTDKAIHLPDERVIYYRTPESEDAFAKLLQEFEPAIRWAVRAVPHIDYDDAHSVATEEFVKRVRAHDLSGDPLSSYITSALRNAVIDYAREDQIITIRKNVVFRYWRLMHSHGQDAVSAYDECKRGGSDLAPATFLQVHSLMGGHVSLDVYSDTLEDPQYSPEDIVVQRDEIARLFHLVSSRQEAVLRLRFGFTDPVTEAYLVNTGLHLGSVLTDAQVGGVLDIPRPTVQREKNRALDTMREAVLGSEE